MLCYFISHNNHRHFTILRIPSKLFIDITQFRCHHRESKIPTHSSNMNFEFTLVLHIFLRARRLGWPMGRGRLGWLTMPGRPSIGWPKKPPMGKPMMGWFIIPPPSCSDWCLSCSEYAKLSLFRLISAAWGLTLVTVSEWAVLRWLCFLIVWTLNAFLVLHVLEQSGHWWQNPLICVSTCSFTVYLSLLL